MIACGEGGIRTRGTRLNVRQFSKLLVSATHPPHLGVLKSYIPVFGDCKDSVIAQISKRFLNS